MVRILRQNTNTLMVLSLVAETMCLLSAEKATESTTYFLADTDKLSEQKAKVVPAHSVHFEQFFLCNFRAQEVFSSSRLATAFNPSLSPSQTALP